MKPYEELQREYKLPKHDLYKYLQIRHLLTPYLKNIPDQQTEYEKWCFNKAGKKKGLSKIYRTLLSHKSDEKPKHIQKWEKDLNATFTQAQWLQAANAAYKYSKCTNHIENQRKILYRWYKTPSILHQIYPTSLATTIRYNESTHPINCTTSTPQPRDPGPTPRPTKTHIPHHNLSQTTNPQTLENKHYSNQRRLNLPHGLQPHL
ncbi:hypothetical protein XENTR_v10018720 [Xenopus tropicalis]|nr:hypothetical protein XENTR_v10018720 [Xenopus tropicalis]